MRPCYAKQRDANEKPIVAALEAVGAMVERLPGPLPDLLVGYCGGNWLMEVKTLRGLKRKDQPKQQAWRDAWCGQVHIVVEPEDALKLIGCNARRTGT